MKREPSLTSIRGLAALWVFIYHIPIYVGFTIPLNTPLVSAGYLGVPVFFILSIFLLLRSLDENPSLDRYFVRRVKRIWPMYFVTVFAVFLYRAHSVTWLGYQMTFSGVFLDNQDIAYVFWSLQVEEVAYLFFPLVQKLSRNVKASVAVGLIMLSALAFLLILKSGMTPSLWWLPLSLSSYGFGILAYLKVIPKASLPLVLISLFFWDTQSFEMASFIVAPAFAYVVQESSSFGFLKSKYLTWVGDNSYGLYLLHALLLSAFGLLGVAISLPCAWLFEQANKKGIRFAEARLTAFSKRRASPSPSSGRPLPLE